MLQTFQTSLRRFGRPLRFGVVGLSGIVLNSAILWLLVRELHLALALGSLIATEAAILSNFTLNDRWTFRGAGDRSLIGRLLRFNGVALGGMAITAGILTALTSYAHLHLLLANLLAIGAATVWNYVVNSRWTWSRPQPAVRSRRSAVGRRQTAYCLPPTADRLLPTVDEEVAA